jgi:hypothetical protein
MFTAWEVDDEGKDDEALELALLSLDLVLLAFGILS